MKRSSSPWAPLCLAAVLVLLLSPSLPAWQGGEMPDHDLNVSWNDGLYFFNSDQSITVRLGGNVFFDSTWINGDSMLDARALAINPAGGLHEAFEFTSVRFSFDAELYDRLELRSELDFSSGSANFADVYAGIRDVWNGVDVKVGHVKEPLGLEFQTHVNNTLFMWRSEAAPFVPGYNSGVLVSGNMYENKRGSWAVGAFRNTNLQGGNRGDSDEWSFTGRYTGLVLDEETEDSVNLVHLGAGLSYRMMDTGALVLGAHPEISGTVPQVATVTIPSVDDYYIVGLEGLWINNRFSLQTEYLTTAVDPMGALPKANLSGWYVEGSYFLTDDHRPYDRERGALASPTRPNDPAVCNPDGCGALEAKARYSSADYSDGGYSTDELTDITLGVNYYVTPNARVMFEVGQLDLDGVGDSLYGQLRMQVNF